MGVRLDSKGPILSSAGQQGVRQLMQSPPMSLATICAPWYAMTSWHRVALWHHYVHVPWRVHAHCSSATTTGSLPLVGAEPLPASPAPDRLGIDLSISSLEGSARAGRAPEIAGQHLLMALCRALKPLLSMKNRGKLDFWFSQGNWKWITVFIFTFSKSLGILQRFPRGSLYPEAAANTSE